MKNKTGASVLVGSNEVIDYLNRLNNGLLSEAEAKKLSVDNRKSRPLSNDPDPIDYGGQPGDKD